MQFKRSRSLGLSAGVARKMLAVFMAIVLCFPTTLTSNLTSFRQAQAESAAQSQTDDSSADSASQDSGDSADDSAQEGEGSSSDPESDKGSTGESGSAAGTDDEGSETDGSDSESDEAQVEPLSSIDWNNQTEALKLSSDGLTIDTNALREAVNATDSDEPQLPETISASLDLSFKLDASKFASDSDSAAAHDAVIPGDTASVTLPEGFAPADSSATFEVFQADDEGKATKVKIADAAWDGSSLKLTFVAPVNTKTSETALDVEEASKATNTEGATRTVLKASIALPVTMQSSLVGEKESTVEWTLQQDTDRVAKLIIPSKDDLLKLIANNDGNAQATVEEDDSSANIRSIVPTPSGTSGKASFTTLWADNSSSDRPGVDGISSEYKLYFTISGDDATYEATIANLQEYLGIADEDLSTYAVSLKESGQSYIASASGLANKVTRTNTSQQGSTGTEHDVTWTIKHEISGSYASDYKQLAKGDYNGATDSYVGDDKECLQLLEDVTFTVIVRDGTGALDSSYSVDSWKKSFGANQTVSTLMNHNEIASVAGALEGSTFSVKGSRVIVNAQMPKYYPDNTELDYELVDNSQENQQTASDGTVDYYQVSYNNARVANHSSDISAAWNGGSVTLTHTGTTKFNATKQWLDEDDKARTDTKYSLYRYSINGGTTATAAQVTSKSGAYIEFTVTAAENNQEDTIDLGAKMHAAYAGQNEPDLAKYDPDGYPYIYFLREDSVTGYQRVAGVITEDESHKASIEYNQANYDGSTLTDGDWNTVTIPDKASSKVIAIYNDGTISNVRSETVNAELTKAWNAGAYQDQLSNVVVKMQLKRHALTDDMSPSADTGLYTVDDTWESVGDAVELTDWTSGNMSQTVSASQPKYDSLGHEYVYEWCEVDVSVDGKSKFTPYAKGDYAGVTGTAELSLKDEQGNSEKVTFEGSYSATKADDGSFASKTITNTYTGSTTARVTKYWNVNGENVSGETQPYGVAPGATFTVKDEDGKDVTKTFPSSLSFKLYQDDVEYASGFTADGTVDTEWSTLKLEDGTEIKWRESSPWQLDFDGMPKYDANGTRYTYQAVEVTPNGFSSSSSFKASTDEEDFEKADGSKNNRVVNFASVYNSPYPGEGTLVRLSKEWIDGGNNTGRDTVSVEIYAKSDVKKKNGDYLVKDGKKVTAGTVIATVTLNDANGWYNEVSISAGGGMYLSESESVPEGFEPGSGNGFYYGVREVSNSNYDVITKDEATGVYADVALSPWNDGSNRLVTHKDSADSKGGYAYDISYGTATDPQGSKIVVKNRRLGLVNIQLSKTWVDEGADTSARPNAYYVLLGEQGGIFYLDGDNVYVKLPNSETKYPLYKDENHTQALTKDDLAGLTEFTGEGGSADKLYIQISDDNSDKFTVYGFPKYDDEGYAFTYSAAESVDGGTDYGQTGSSSDSTYDTHLQHSDLKTYGFTNGRSGVKDVTFFTRWYDHYVKDTLNQRPDVYLTLYTVDDEGNAKVVDGYESYKWSADNIWNEDDVDQKYNQSATIKDLPKYDSKGREIVYYASITPAVSDETFGEDGLDYTTIEYGTSNTDNGNNKWNAADGEVGKATAKYENASGTNGKTIVREDGTFIFKIASTVTVQGTKVWTNLPGDFDGSLPMISVFLQQRVSDGTTALDQGWEALKVSTSAGDGLTGAGYDVQNASVATPDKTTAIAWTTLSGFSATKTSKTFSFTTYGENVDGKGSADNLAMYDENGYRYEYHAREIMDGLIQDASGNPAGGFTLDELASKVDAENNCYAGPAVTSSGIGSSFRINNAFKQDQGGTITVNKLFSNRAAGDKFPTVKFTLYRAADAESIADDAWEKVDQKTLDTTAIQDPNGSGTVTFDKLALYAPDGSRYQYKVVEDAVSGYTTYAAAGNKSASDLTTEANEVAGLYPANDGTAADGTDQASFKNIYTADSVSLSGTKTWYDQNNLTNCRPNDLDLKLVRSYDKARHLPDESLTDGEITLQSDDPTAEGYIEWNKDSSSNKWTFTIKNLEKWSPAGEAWYYTLTEATVPDGYKQNNSKGGTVRADNSKALTNLAFGNYLEATVGFEKTWENDGGDPYYQRPRVGIRLQSRVVYDDASKSDWKDAGQTLIDEFGATLKKVSSYGMQGYEIPDAGGAGTIKQSVTLFAPTQGSSFKTLWKDLSTAGVTTKGKSVSIEYRVVEVQLEYGYAGSTGDKSLLVAPTEDTGDYQGSYGSYEAKQTGLTSVTNTLDTTQITVMKTWSDSDNKWSLRPESVTYYLRYKTDDGTWKWMSKYGADVKDVTSSSDAIKFTVSASDNWVKTFDYLPKVDSRGEAYTYQLVESVPTGYAVTSDDCSYVNVDGSDSNGSATGLVTVPVSSNAQTFENNLDVVTIRGQKMWTSYGASILESVPLKVTQIKNGKSTVLDTNKYAVNWVGSSSDRSSYVIEGLPKYASDGTQYQYLVTEEAGAVDGYYPTNPSDPASWAVDDSYLNNGNITNTATRFTFDKLDATGSTGATGEQLNGAQFTVKDSDGNTVAVWTRDDQGNTSVSDTNGCVGVDGYIVALKAGTYTVSETQTPANHTKMADFGLSIAKDGAISVAKGADGVSVSTEGDSKVATVSVTDQVVRGEVSLYKYYRHVVADLVMDKKYGEEMTFDLYKKGAGIGGSDLRVATGIATDGNGNWTSKDSDVALTGLGSYYTTLADGLPLGDYYFKETGENDLTQTSDATKDFTIADNGTAQPEAVSVEFENSEFDAKAELTKLDATDGTDLRNAKFELTYNGKTIMHDGKAQTFLSGCEYRFDATGTIVEGWNNTDYSLDTGTLRLVGLKKGTYVLKEVSNTGYVVDSKEMTLEVTDDMQGQTLSFTEDGKMENQRLTGTVTMKKTDGTDALAGSVFKLQKKTDGNWTDVEGKGSLTTGDDGTITVDGLEWGTYRFAEVTPTAGYYGTATTDEVTIDRNTVSETQDCGTVSNTITNMSLEKTDGSSVITTSEATFELTPADGSSFADGSTKAREIKTSTGSFTLRGELVSGNTYTLKETVAPDGYELNGTEFKFTFTEDGKIQPVEGSDYAGYAVNGDESINVVVADEAINVSLGKNGTDSDEQLEGALYTIEALDGGAFIGQEATKFEGVDASLIASLQLKQNGTYRVTETTAPAGYELAGSFTFKVDEYGNVAELSQPDNGAVTSDGSALTLSDNPIEIFVGKLGSDTGDELLAGATFELTGGDEAMQVTTVAGEKSVYSKLVAGVTYTLSETEAPAGYDRQVGSFTFAVQPDGTIEWDGDLPQGIQVEEGNVSILATDNPIKVSLAKSGVAGNVTEAVESLEGAEFELTGKVVTSDGVQEYNAERVTPEQIADLKFMEGEYTLREVKAPAGYAVDSSELKFAIGGDWKVVVTQAAEAYTLGEENDLYMTDRPIELQLLKQYDNMALKGAEVELADLTDGSQGAITVKLGDGTGVWTAGLIGGHEYALTETKAPKGYKTLEGDVTLSVAEDGTLSLSKNEATNGSVSLGDGQLVIEDQPLDSEKPAMDGSDDGTSSTKTGDYLMPILAAVVVIALVSGGVLLYLNRRNRRVRKAPEIQGKHVRK